MGPERRFHRPDDPPDAAAHADPRGFHAGLLLLLCPRGGAGGGGSRSQKAAARGGGADAADRGLGASGGLALGGLRGRGGGPAGELVLGVAGARGDPADVRRAHGTAGRAAAVRVDRPARHRPDAGAAAGRGGGARGSLQEKGAGPGEGVVFPGRGS